MGTRCIGGGGGFSLSVCMSTSPFVGGAEVGCGVGEEVCMRSTSLAPFSMPPLLLDMTGKVDNLRSSGGRLRGCVVSFWILGEDLLVFVEDLEEDFVVVLDDGLVDSFEEDFTGGFVAVIDEADFEEGKDCFRSLSCDFRADVGGVAGTGESRLSGLLSLVVSVPDCLVDEVPGLSESLVLMVFGREEVLEKIFGKTITR